MTRRPLLTLLAVALTIAASVFFGALLAILVAFRLLLPDPAAAASRSAQQADSPTPSGEMTTERQVTLPSPDFAGRSSGPQLCDNASAGTSSETNRLTNGARFASPRRAPLCLED